MLLVRSNTVQLVQLHKYVKIVLLLLLVMVLEDVNVLLVILQLDRLVNAHRILLKVQAFAITVHYHTVLYALQLINVANAYPLLLLMLMVLALVLILLLIFQTANVSVQLQLVNSTITVLLVILHIAHLVKQKVSVLPVNHHLSFH